MADYLLTDVRPRGFTTPVDIAMAGGRIAAVGAGLERGHAEVIDGGGRAVLPGLVEPHLHLDKALLGGGEASTLDDAVAVTARAKERFTAEDVRERATTVLRWALAAGTTVVRTPVDVDPTVGLTSLDVLLDLRERWADHVEIQVVAFPQEGLGGGTYELLAEALRRGADVVGACSYAEDDVEACRANVRSVFDLAERFGVPVDVHADFGNPADPRHALAAEIAATTTARGMAGRVVLGHVTTLAGLDDDRRAHTLAALAEARVGVVVLPPTDLYLQGRTAPVPELLAAGVPSAFSSNNVRNAFTPFGNADVLETGLLLAQLGGGVDPETVLDLAVGAGALIDAAGCGLAVGDRADLVVLDAADHARGMLDRAPRRWVVAGGRVVAEHETRATLHAPSAPPGAG